MEDVLSQELSTVRFHRKWLSEFFLHFKSPISFAGNYFYKALLITIRNESKISLAGNYFYKALMITIRNECKMEFCLLISEEKYCTIKAQMYQTATDGSM